VILTEDLWRCGANIGHKKLSFPAFLHMYLSPPAPRYRSSSVPRSPYIGSPHVSRTTQYATASPGYTHQRPYSHGTPPLPRDYAYASPAAPRFRRTRSYSQPPPVTRPAPQHSRAYNYGAYGHEYPSRAYGSSSTAYYAPPPPPAPVQTSRGYHSERRTHHHDRHHEPTPRGTLWGRLFEPTPPTYRPHHSGTHRHHREERPVYGYRR